MASRGWATLLLVLVPTGLWAQEIKSVEPVVVTATKIETPAERLGAAVTVITEDELVAHGFTTVGDALRRVPGVDIQQQGGPGKNTTIRIRGARSDQVQVLVDGMRVKSATTGDFNFATLAIDQIERIEVVRGPQASLYGADAIGGVVNIVTKRGRGPLSATGLLQGGSHETHRERLTISGAAAPFDYAFAASAYATGGQFKNDDAEQRAVSGKLGLTLSPDSSGTVSLRYAKSSTDLPVNDPIIAAPPHFRLDPDAQQDNELAVVSLEWAHKLVAWDELRLRFGQMWQDRGFVDPATPELDRRTTVSQVQNRRREMELVNHLHGGEWTTLSLGVERREEWAQARRSFRRSAETRSAFGHDELRLLDRLFLSAGVRVEDHEVFGTETTPRAGAALVIKEWGSKLRGSWSKGFRAPTLNDLFFPNFGNPELRPERSVAWDAGVEQTLIAGRVRLEATVFRTSYEDLIQNVRVAGTLRPENVARAVTEGFEVVSAVDLLDTLAATLNYTFTSGEDLTNRLPLRRLPRHRWNIGLTWDPLPVLNLYVDTSVVSSQFEAVGFPRNPGYHRIDTGGTYRMTERRGLRPGLAASLRLQNVTNQRYSETLGFEAPGVSVLVGFEARY